MVSLHDDTIIQPLRALGADSFRIEKLLGTWQN
jgi:hypothetical protein